MDAFFASGRAADLMLGVMAAEALILAWLWRGQRGAALRIASLLLPGAALVFALRAALTGSGWPLVAAAVTCALVAHLADVVLRDADIRRPDENGGP